MGCGWSNRDGGFCNRIGKIILDVNARVHAGVRSNKVKFLCSLPDSFNIV
jgi:hypothetical protein